MKFPGAIHHHAFKVASGKRTVSPATKPVNTPPSSAFFVVISGLLRKKSKGRSAIHERMPMSKAGNVSERSTPESNGSKNGRSLVGNISVLFMQYQ